MPQFTRVKKFDDRDTLIATWPDDDFEWSIPNTTPDAAPQEKSEQTLWSGDDSDGDKIRVIVVNHANRGVWLAIRKGARKQLLQMVGFADTSLQDAKKVT
eukprot:16421-Pyramimonas_sp.AAC.1